jgi:hypothetical protein
MSKEQKTEDKDKALHIADVMFSLSEVMNKKIRYKNGSVCKIVGGNKEVGLGRLEDIVEVLN